MKVRYWGCLLALVALSACETSGERPRAIATRAGNGGDAPTFFDCLRNRKVVLVSAHRAGSQLNLPENSRAALRATAAAGVGMVEVDVASTKDGALVLMHDDRVDRTTDGNGFIAEMTLGQVRKLRLRDDSGARTDESVPTFAEILAEAHKQGLMMQIDLQEEVDLKAVAAQIAKAKMQQRVVLISYDIKRATALHAAAPWAMITHPVKDPAAIDELVWSGLPLDQILAWTGNRRPDPELYAELAGRGVEVIFGTLGRPGERLDDVIARDGDTSEYLDLVRFGVTIVATDTHEVAEKTLRVERGDESVFAQCPLPK